jgi:colanic acid/amylovoran biosynthesis protein
LKENGLAMKPQKTILLSYLLLTNIGCEIILRGTIAFLTRAFPDHDLKFLIPSYDVARDRKLFSDLENIDILPMVPWKRYLRGFLAKTRLNRRFWSPRFASRHFRRADLFVSVGGDIYTMFGNRLPEDWLGYEQFATRHGIPSIMFGANMERFEILNATDRTRLLDHLKRFCLIAVRDAKTLELLESYGAAQNAVVFSDPVFALRPRTEVCLQKVKTIGLNISPILSRDFGPDIVTRFAKITEGLVKEGYRVLLIPHVYASDGNPGLDDRMTLKALADALAPEILERVALFDGSLSLRGVADAIAEVDLFVGARMHACLNATTLGRPTFYLGYSAKASAMVEWLVNASPFALMATSLSTKSADAVELDDILGLITAHETWCAEHRAPVMIDTQGFLDASPIWTRLGQSHVFKD